MTEKERLTVLRADIMKGSKLSRLRSPGREARRRDSGYAGSGPQLVVDTEVRALGTTVFSLVGFGFYQ